MACLWRILGRSNRSFSLRGKEEMIMEQKGEHKPEVFFTNDQKKIGDRKNSLNYKGFLTFVIITISVIPLCLCAPSFAPPPLLCGSTFAPPYALRPQLCNPPFLCGGMFAPPVCFAPSTLHPPCSLRGYLCTPPETLTAAQQQHSTIAFSPQSYPRKVTPAKLPPQSYPRKVTPAKLPPQT